MSCHKIIGGRLKLRKQANIPYTISSPPKPKITVRTSTKGTSLKILTPKQMLQKLPIALDNTSHNLLNKMRQIVYL